MQILKSINNGSGNWVLPRVGDLLVSFFSIGTLQVEDILTVNQYVAVYFSLYPAFPSSLLNNLCLKIALYSNFTSSDKLQYLPNISTSLDDLVMAMIQVVRED